MSITGMLVQMQRRISSPNGRQKHERNMETDTDDNTEFYPEKCGFQIVGTEKDGGMEPVRFLAQR